MTTGIVGLVPLAELLAETVGSRKGAVRLAARILDEGAQALPRSTGDIVYAARRELVDTGVVTENGVPVAHRAAELVIVCEVLATSTLPDSQSPNEQRLVLSAPAETATISDAERLDGLVLDVIRNATRTLHLGGAFWNPAGFDRLDEVLIPALEVRAITAVVYANSPVEEHHRASLHRHLGRLTENGQVALRWFSGPRPTMLHAKFVIADSRIGYLGTANLTSWGFRGHIEAGVELTAGQAERFVRFLGELEMAGLFTDNPPAPPFRTTDIRHSRADDGSN
ncbi:phospholipase D-like domain-containing protein [Nocardia sp. NPDC047038]|uniref:phospholipase D-like domain-containing protein n=1 Tax=Nocardia sp. NPDC047038 TaxID=3154338 RepID=UPI00340C67CB